MEIITFLDAHNGIISLSLSVVAIIIAIWSSNSTSKAANKQIKQTIKLQLMQLENEVLNLNAEILKIDFEMFHSKEKILDANKDIKKLRQDLMDLYNYPSRVEKRKEIEHRIGLLKDKYYVQYSWWIDLFEHQSKLVFQRSHLIESINQMKKEI